MDSLLRMAMLVLYFISNFGYWEFFRKRSHMSIFFLPAFTVCAQICLLFCAGILNCLEICTVLLFLIGLLLAACFLIKDFKHIVGTYCTVGYAFFFAAICIVWVATRGHVFTHYDNFTHWALVVRNMLETNRYPSFKDPLISFQAYPLGSATYVYYAAKIVSTSEHFQMVAQAYMMLSFILPVFKYARKNRIVSAVYIMLFTNYIFCFNTQIVNLLVDTLLPLLGGAMVFFLYSECLGYDNERKKGDVSVLYAIPFLCTAVQIKNSGIYFVIIAIILILTSLKIRKTDFLENVTTILTPFLTLFFWKTHCSYVFLEASTSEHAMTLEHYKEEFSLKTWEEISNTIVKVAKYAFTGKELYFLIAFFAFLGLLTFLADAGSRKKYLKIVMVSAAVYIVYMIGMLFMYLFSMPSFGTANLSGAGRYRRTILIALYYVLIVSSLAIAGSIENGKKRFVYFIVLFSMLTINWRGERGRFETFFYNKWAAAGERYWFEKAIADNNVPKGSSYMIYIPQNDSGYTYYLCKFLLYSDNLFWHVITDGTQLNNAEDWEYAFIYDTENEFIQKWIEANYPDQVGNTVIKRNLGN